MKKCRKNPRGITLVALVITIIVLLILAGISIQAITNTGIFEKANRAIDEYTKASMKEQIAMYVSEATHDYYLNNPEGKTYLEFIAEYLENKRDVIIDVVEQNEDEVILNYTQGKNIVQILLSSDGTIEIIGSGTTSSGIEDTYAPKISYDASTTSSITVTIKDSSGVEAYACSLENTKPSTDSSSWNKIESPEQTKQITITGLTANQIYYVFAKDTKGNISEGKACKTIDYEQVVVTYKESSTSQTVLETIKTKHTAIITLISKPSSLNKEGYDFIGWSENENSEKALDITYIVPNHNVTLYPVWKKSEVSISLVGAVEEKITVEKNGTEIMQVNTDANGKAENVKLPVGTFTFTGSVSEQSFERIIDENTTEVYVMPDGFMLYWYGNTCEFSNGGMTRCIADGWSSGGCTIDFNKNNIYMASGANAEYYITSFDHDFSIYNTVYVKARGLRAEYPDFAVVFTDTNYKQLQFFNFCYGAPSSSILERVSITQTESYKKCGLSIGSNRKCYVDAVYLTKE